jgi:putative DNA primase/helicase
MAAGAVLPKVHTIRSVRNADQTRRAFSLQADLARLETEITKRKDVRLVVIDPISSYLGKVDSHKNAEVRTVLETLGEMAARLRVAVICNNHFSKSGGNANGRIIGSVAFVNQARAAFIVSDDAEDVTGTRKFLMPSKMNIAPIKYGLAYRIEGCFIEGEIFTSRIMWEPTPIERTADEVLAATADDSGSRTGKEEAIEFLRATLKGGPMLASDAGKEARAAGISAKSMRAARAALGIKPAKAGMHGGWVWTLPEAPKMPSPPEDAHVQERAPSAPRASSEG